MKYTKVKSKTVQDNTGNVTELPVLLIEKNEEVTPLWSLHRYCLKYKTRSLSWHNKLIYAVTLLLEYMEANHDSFTSPKELFESFADAVHTGTIDEEGYDPSDLYWLPRRIQNARQLLMELSYYSDWMHKEYGTLPLNPWREATNYEERLKWIAIINKNEFSFLGHTADYTKMSEIAKRVRNVVERKTPVGEHGEVKFFPEDKINELLMEGFKVSNKTDNILNQYNWRDIAITILMHGGGLRLSECFHLWVHDVFPDPDDNDLPIVRVYHPSDGAAPKDFKMPNGKYLSNRAEYLLMKYGLKPRNEYLDIRHAGWKNPKMTDTQQNFLQVHWFPKDWGYLFMQVWKMYLTQRLRKKIADTHPYLFVSFNKKQHGEIYSIKSFRESHERAVRKIGLTVGKAFGTTPHGHRHAYGQRLSNAKVDPLITQAGLHHKSPESQKVYTEPTIARITEELSKANTALDSGEKLPMIVDLDAWHEEERKKQKQYIQKGKKR